MFLIKNNFKILNNQYKSLICKLFLIFFKLFNINNIIRLNLQLGKSSQKLREKNKKIMINNLNLITNNELKQLLISVTKKLQKII